MVTRHLQGFVIGLTVVPELSQSLRFQGRAPVTMAAMNRKSLSLCLLLCLAACDGGSEPKRLAAAQALLDKKDVKGAVIELKNALDKNPSSVQARLLLGQTLLQSGDPRTALQELVRAQEAGASDTQVGPDIARALLASGEPGKLIAQYRDLVIPDALAMAELKTALAQAYVTQDDLAMARLSVQAALKAQPDHAAAKVWQARLDAAEGDTEGALRQLEAVLARDRGHAAAGLAKGEILLRSPGNGEAALEVFRQVRSANPDLVAGHVAVLGALLQQSQRVQARTEFEALRKLAPRHADTLILQAQFAFDDKNYANSLELSQQLLAVNPADVRALVLAGAAEFQMQRYALAASHLSKAMKAAPQMWAAQQLLAQTYLRDAQPEKAIALLQPWIDGPNANRSSLAMAGEAYLQMGDVARSEAAFGRALKAAPGDPGVRVSLAQVQLARGNTGPAIAQLEAIATGDKGTQADMALISARLRQNDPQGALRALDELAKKLPEQAYPLALQGRLRLAQGDTAAAAASFEKALLKQPNHLPALVALAGIDAQAGKPDAARQRLRGLLKAEPKNFRAKMALAALESRLGAPDAVVAEQLREAVKIDPSQADAHRALIDHLMAHGDSPGALGAAQDATAAQPQDPGLMELLGRAQLAAGDSQQAVSTFKKLVASQPAKAQYAVQLADAYMAGKDSAAAVGALRQALVIEPDNVGAQRGLALLAAMDKRPQDALAIARAMQQRRPKEAAGYVLEGELQGREGNWRAAAIAFSAALQRGRSSALAINLHSALGQAGKAPEAARMAVDWQKNNPMDAAFAYYLGDAATAARNWPVAEAHYRTVLALDPRHAAAMNNIAWLLATQRKPGATEMAQQANQLLPNRAPFLDTLALALEVDNQLPKALLAQKQAVELAPRDPALRLRLAQLQIKHGDKSDARKELESLSKLGDRFAGQAEVTALLKGL